jgi:hypothetical protein
MSTVPENSFVFLCPKDDIKLVEDVLAYQVLTEKVHYVTKVREYRDMTIITADGIDTSLSYYDWKLM